MCDGVCGIERTDAHQAVHAPLCLEITVRVRAAHREARALDARLFSVLRVEHLHVVTRAAPPSAESMRCSICAQSWLSVPPAPALIDTSASLSSCSPPSMRCSSSLSTDCRVARTIDWSTSAAISASTSASSFSSVAVAASDLSRLREHLDLSLDADTLTLHIAAAGVGVLPQGRTRRRRAPASSSSLFCWPGMSKVPPQLPDALLQLTDGLYAPRSWI